MKRILKFALYGFLIYLFLMTWIGYLFDGASGAWHSILQAIQPWKYL